MSSSTRSPDPVWRPVLPIRTARLDLRAHRMADLDDLLVFHGDEAVVRHLPWPVRDRAATRAALARKLDQGVAGPGEPLVLAVVERVSAVVVGEVLLKRGDDAASAEVGYVLRADRQGRGYAAEAVQALLDYGAGVGVDRFTAVVEPPNLASARLLERLGFGRHAQADHTAPDGAALHAWLRG